MRTEPVERFMRVTTGCNRAWFWPVVASFPTRLTLHGGDVGVQQMPA